MTRVLVVTANQRMSRALEVVLTPLGRVDRKDSAEVVTEELLKPGDLAGFVLGADVPDRLQAELVERIKLVYPMSPVAVIVDPLGHVVTMDARTGPPCVAYVGQPLSPARLLLAVRDALTRPHEGTEATQWIVWATDRSFRLTDAERFLLRARLENYGLPWVAAHRGVSVNTVRKQVRSLLRRCGAGSMRELCVRQRRVFDAVMEARHVARDSVL